MAALTLVVAVLPAEYGIDPTGFGALVGITQLAASNDLSDNTEGPNGAGEPDFNASTETRYTYEAKWPLSPAALGTFEGYAAEGAPITVTIPVTLANLTALTASLSWVDDNRTAGQSTDPDYFEVKVRAPDGVERAAAIGRNTPGGNGTATARVDWRPQPYPRETEAAHPSKARAAFLAMEPGDASAAGDWTVEVTLLQAGDASVNGVPLPGAVDGAKDAGNTWSLTLTADTFALDFKSKPGSGIQLDSLTFTLEPGKEFEYKLGMAEGESVEYAWSTGGPSLYYDFHGDRDGDASGGFTRHKAGTSSADQGTLKAPFTGRHGWFWRNEGNEPATVTLETRGTYVIIGKV